MNRHDVFVHWVVPLLWPALMGAATIGLIAAGGGIADSLANASTVSTLPVRSRQHAVAPADYSRQGEQRVAPQKPLAQSSWSRVQVPAPAPGDPVSERSDLAGR